MAITYVDITARVESEAQVRRLATAQARIVDRVPRRVLAAIGWVLVFRAMRERIGMRRVRYASSGAAAIAPEVLQFFIGLGVPVFELYGMTENSAIATVAQKIGSLPALPIAAPRPRHEVAP